MEEHHNHQGIKDHENGRQPSWASTQFGKCEREQRSNAIPKSNTGMDQDTLISAGKAEIDHKNYQHSQSQPGGTPFAMPSTLLAREIGFVSSKTEHAWTRV